MMQCLANEKDQLKVRLRHEFKACLATLPDHPHVHCSAAVFPSMLRKRDSYSRSPGNSHAE